MVEGYSLDKFKGAKQEHLHPEQRERLEKLREIKRLWRSIGTLEDPRAALGILRHFRDAVRYVLPQGKREHRDLETAQRKTKEGQLELAQEEAGFFNDEFDTRARKVEETFARKDDSPEDALAYRKAIASFSDLADDLRDTDLRQYAESIRIERLFNEWGMERYGDRIMGADEWHPTQEKREAALLEQLEKLPDGPAARALYEQLQDPSLSEKEFFDGIYGFQRTMLGHPFDEKEVRHVVTKDLGNGRLLQITFYENGYIEFAGKDPIHSFRYPSSPSTGDVIGSS